MKKKQIETHGKIQDGQPTTLEQIFGFNELAKYGTKDESQYQLEIDEMNRTDLENHARKVGVVIVESTARLKDNLIREFKNYVVYLHRPPAENKPPVKVSDAVRRILAEGR